MLRVYSVTGTRADYSILKPVYQALEQSPSIELGVIVTAMHLSEAYGSTVREIEADGFPIVATIDTLGDNDTRLAMAEFAADTISEMANFLEKNPPDVLLILGDRVEQYAAATAAMLLRIPIAHIHGGEFTGTVDEYMRHCITQMADIHFTTAVQHSDNVLRMKPRQSPEQVYTVGAPALDTVLSAEFTPRETLCAKYNFPPTEKLLLFVQHPDVDDARTPAEQLEPSLVVLSAFQGNIMIIGSNADAGGNSLNKKLAEFAASRDNVAYEVTLPHVQFLSWEAACDVLVGNSSSGIIEAASFHTPVVNIGNRQKGRLRSGNVLDVDYDADEIAQAIDQALHDESFLAQVADCSNAYGNGTAAVNITKVLEALVK